MKSATAWTPRLAAFYALGYVFFGATLGASVRADSWLFGIPAGAGAFILTAGLFGDLIRIRRQQRGGTW